MSPVSWATLSESFAVIAYRHHTLAVRNGVKFRGIFLIFDCQTLFSRPTFGSIRPTFGSIEYLWKMLNRMMTSG
jgi:hypothetical protein